MRTEKKKLKMKKKEIERVLISTVIWGEDVRSVTVHAHAIKMKGEWQGERKHRVYTQGEREKVGF